jgi:hypothetical protein
MPSLYCSLWDCKIFNIIHRCRPRGLQLEGGQELTETVLVVNGPAASDEMDGESHAGCARSKATIKDQLRAVLFTAYMTYTEARRKTAEMAIFRCVFMLRDQI